MTYEQAVAFWFGRINYEVKSARPGDLKLERMRSLLKLLEQPQHYLRTIHITGTKGKGSTATMVASILQKAGYSVGLFTSPHLVHVNERVQINGVHISDDEVAARITQIRPFVEELDKSYESSPTFFEIGTALGLLHFHYRRVDFAVVEVGLGGRFDSTNVIMPMVSAITSIGLDHVSQLGNTLEAIAFQKAGIIKRKVPVVCGHIDASPLQTIREVAVSEKASMTVLGHDFHVKYVRPNQAMINGQTFDLAMLGEHQAKNAAVAVEIVRQLQAQGVNVPDRAFQTGLKTANVPARIEVLPKKNPASLEPTVVVDSAHNVPSIMALLTTLKESFPKAVKKTCIFAVSSDKPYPEMLEKLKEYFHHFIITKYSNNPRCVSAEKILPLLNGQSFEVSGNPKEAYAMAIESLGRDDLLVVAGSMFLAGELRYELIGKQ